MNRFAAASCSTVRKRSAVSGGSVVISARGRTMGGSDAVALVVQVGLELFS